MPDLRQELFESDFVVRSLLAYRSSSGLLIRWTGIRWWNSSNRSSSGSAIIPLPRTVGWGTSTSSWIRMIVKLYTFWIFEPIYMWGKWDTFFPVTASMLQPLCPVFPDASIDIKSPVCSWLPSANISFIFECLMHPLGPCVAARRYRFRFKSPFSIMIKSPPPPKNRYCCLA